MWSRLMFIGALLIPLGVFKSLNIIELDVKVDIVTLKPSVKII